MQYNRTGLESPHKKSDEIRIRDMRHADIVKLFVMVLIFVVFVLTIAK